jgi:predicted signal transduction protein with EAL and GGDEF domain
MAAHDGGPSHVGVSVGLAVTRGREHSVHGLLAESDRDLYRDKHERKAGVVLSEEEQERAHSAA